MRSIAAACLALVSQAKVSDYADLIASKAGKRTETDNKLIIQASFDEHNGERRAVAEGSKDVGLSRIDLLRDTKSGFTIVTEHQGESLKTSIGYDNDSVETLMLKKTAYLDDYVDDEEESKFLDDLVAKRSYKPKAGSHDADPTGAEVDSNGFIVIDLFCGFTKGAAAYVKNHLQMACEYSAVATTSALADSGITNARLRVVGVDLLNETEDLDRKWWAINEDCLKESIVFSEPLGARYGADLHVTFTLRDASMGGKNRGIAYRPGRFALVTIDSIGSSVHEIGHNFDLSHCPSSRFPLGNTGYLVPELGYGTLLCGDFIPYWSNPDLLYNGYALGDSVTSSVRMLQTSLARTSSKAKHVFDLDANIPRKQLLYSGSVVLKEDFEISNPIALNITATFETLWVVTNRGDISYIFIGQGKPPTVEDNYAWSYFPYIQLHNAPPGIYYFALFATKPGAQGTTRQIDIWAPAVDGE